MPEHCEDIRKKIDNYIIGQLSEHESEKIEKHCQECENCNRELAVQKELRQSFAALPELRCPGTVTRNIEHSTYKKSFISKMPPTVKWMGGLATAAVLVIALLINPKTEEAPLQGYTPAELEQKKKELTWGLAHVGKTMDKAEKKAVGEVFFDTLPKEMNRSLKKTFEILSGGLL